MKPFKISTCHGPPYYCDINRLVLLTPSFGTYRWSIRLAIISPLSLLVFISPLSESLLFFNSFRQLQFLCIYSLTFLHFICEVIKWDNINAEINKCRSPELEFFVLLVEVRTVVVELWSRYRCPNFIYWLQELPLTVAWWVHEHSWT